jgi:surface antigen
MKQKIFGLIAIVGLLSACAQDGNNSVFNKQNAGTLLGGAAGAWAGSNIGGGSGRIIATAVGGVLGALVGSSIGQSLDEKDRMIIGNTTHSTLETIPPQQPAQWRNPQSGHYGEVVAGPVYQDDGYNCRPFTQTIFIDGRTETARGNACKQPDGTWRIVNS